MHRDPSKAQLQECKAGNLQVLSVGTCGTISTPCNIVSTVQKILHTGPFFTLMDSFYTIYRALESLLPVICSLFRPVLHLRLIKQDNFRKTFHQY